MHFLNALVALLIPSLSFVPLPLLVALSQFLVSLVRQDVVSVSQTLRHMRFEILLPVVLLSPEVRRLRFACAESPD